MSAEEFAGYVEGFFEYLIVPVPIPLVILAVLFGLVWRFSK